MEYFLEDWFKYEDFSVHFEDLIDHRESYKIKHDIKEVVLLALAAIICGAESWLDIENFGTGKIRFLRTILPYKNGIPSQYTIQRIFCSIDRNHFAECLDDWLSEIREKQLSRSRYYEQEIPEDKTDLPERHEEYGIKLLHYKQLCIDGKTIRGAASRSDENFHVLSAWCVSLGMFLAQERVQNKSNEITAIPKLLEKVPLDDTIVTIDAMGCQREIAEQITDNGGQYILAVKKNQGSLYEQIDRFFGYYSKVGFKDEKRILSQYDFPIELNGGRIEERKVVMVNSAAWIYGDEKWQGINSVIAVYSSTTNKKSKKTYSETRYYISSIKSSAKHIGAYIRKHWNIENCLHWTLDAIFNEDKIKMYQRNAAANIATIRRLSLMLLKAQKKPKQSIKALKSKATFNNRTLKKVLML